MKVSIDEKYFDLLESLGQRQYIPSDQHVFMENEEADTIYVIVSGRVRVYISAKNGKEITLEVLKKGRLFGDSSFVNHTYRKVNIIAVTDVELIACSTKRLSNALSSYPELMMQIFQHMSQTCDYLTHQIVRLISYNAKGKVIDFLLEETQEGQHTLPFTHDNVAECLNMNRVTVTRIIKELSDKGIVTSDYGKIAIKDVRKLKHLLDEQLNQ